MTVEVYKNTGLYGRDHVLYIEDDWVIFDTADEEYNRGGFPLQLLEDKIKEYKKKRDENLPHI